MRLPAVKGPKKCTMLKEGAERSNYSNKLDFWGQTSWDAVQIATVNAPLMTVAHQTLFRCVNDKLSSNY